MQYITAGKHAGNGGFHVFIYHRAIGAGVHLHAGTVPAYIKMATIQPSFTGSVQSMLIPNFGSNPDGAYVFINYMLSDAAQQILVKEMAAIPLVDVSGMDMTGYEDLKDLDVGSFRTLSIGDLGTNFNERWDNEIGSLG